VLLVTNRREEKEKAFFSGGTNRRNKVTKVAGFECSGHSSSQMALLEPP
jgi:hypothetical protein